MEEYPMDVERDRWLRGRALIPGEIENKNHSRIEMAVRGGRGAAAKILILETRTRKSQFQVPYQIYQSLQAWRNQERPRKNFNQNKSNPISENQLSCKVRNAENSPKL